MSCGCGRQATRREVLRTKALAPVAGGLYMLSTYPDCSTVHQGAWAGESTYIIGRGTTDEKLFKRSDLAAATEYAIATKQSIENIPNTGLCDQAIIDLYGA